MVPSTTTRHFFTASPNTVANWFKRCRDICSAELLRVDLRIGGVGHVVEIDETSLKKKSKYGRGTFHPDVWLFG
ncbi:hypothetical protein Gpo141_00015109, partial [Globisporangium polare]